jgi:phosphotriesterase-related protein
MIIMIKSARIFFPLIITGLMACSGLNRSKIMTVKGIIPAGEMGIALTHEHVLVDFIGADSINESRWDKQEVLRKVLPYLLQAKESGCNTFIECTPQYIGRDPVLLRDLSDSSGLNILTNTGLYGASNNKFMPGYAYKETADQLAARWTGEWINGIEGTGIKPGFIKIGVGNGDLSELHRKIVRAAARTHLATGLVIASHTGPAIPAFEQLNLLCEEGVSPEAFIWVHAQSEKDSTAHIMAGKMGAWVSFDGLNEENAEKYLNLISNMKKNHLLHRVLLSHDAGWYTPGLEGGGDIRGYAALFENLIPLLKKEGFTDKELNQLLVKNPAEAFAIRRRTI